MAYVLLWTIDDEPIVALRDAAGAYLGLILLRLALVAHCERDGAEFPTGSSQLCLLEVGKQLLASWLAHWRTT
jgi:hypothetical protein